MFGDVTYECFGFEAYKSLIQLNAEAGLLRLKLDLLNDKVRILLQEKGAYEVVIIEKSSQISLLKTENSRLFSKWKEENRLRHLAEEKPSWGWVPWTVAGGLALSTAVLAGVLILE